MGGGAKSVTRTMPLRLFIDSHMHIQSLKCAPLPIMWCKVPALDMLRLNRDEEPGWNRNISIASIPFLGPYAGLLYGAGRMLHMDNLCTVTGAGIQTKDTVAVAHEAVKECLRFFEDATTRKYLGNYMYLNPFDGGQRTFMVTEGVLRIMVAMSMDMDYCHIAGYDGKTVYQEDTEGRYFCYIRKNAHASYEGGQKHRFTQREKDLYTPWHVQKRDTAHAVLSNPWNLLAMYHYDPRRWSYGSKEEVVSGTRKPKEPLACQAPECQPFAAPKLVRGTWNYPFRDIVSRSRGDSSANRVFFGFKMYPPHGYRPLDEKCPYMLDFYRKCAAQGIPIMVHCSPGGNTIPEQRFYKEYLQAGIGASVGEGDTRVSVEAQESDVEFFNESFIHPNAWKRALTHVQKLRICLAHFGGEEWGKSPDQFKDNTWVRAIKELLLDTRNEVFTDLSCFDLHDKNSMANLREFLMSLGSRDYYDRILLGTDWPMLWMWAVVGTWPWRRTDYVEYCARYKAFLDSIHKSLWPRFTLINPYRFYDLGNPTVLGNYRGALEASLAPFEKKGGARGAVVRKIRGQLESGFEALSKMKAEVDALEEHIGACE
jgi:hypothetical protein